MLSLGIQSHLFQFRHLEPLGFQSHFVQLHLPQLGAHSHLAIVLGVQSHLP